MHIHVDEICHVKEDHKTTGSLTQLLRMGHSRKEPEERVKPTLQFTQRMSDFLPQNIENGVE